MDEGPTMPVEVRLIAIGKALPISALKDAVGSDIPEGLHLTARRESAFDEEAFLSRSGSEPHAIEIWVDATDRRNVHLYFSDSKNARYAIRELELSGSMDEMDMESLAQAIAWSLRALSAGSAGTLNRAEAHLRLSSEPETPPQEDAPEKAPTPGWRSTTRSVFSDARAFYKVGLYSPEIPFVHGPGLGVGLLRGNRDPLLGIDSSVQLQLPSSYEEDGLELELTSLASRTYLQVLKPSHSRLAVGAQIGGGFDVIWWAPSVLRADVAEVRAPATSVALMLGAGMYAQVKLSRVLAINLHLDMEFDVYSPRFQVVTDQTETVFVGRYPLRPTLAAGIGFL